MSGKIISYSYKDTIEIKYWEKYLDRKLKKEEYFIIKQAESENDMNEKIVQIYEIAKLNGLYVPQLTNLHGNCMFESLQYHEICDDVDDFRCGLAFTLIMFKDKKNFIPGDNRSMEESFTDTNFDVPVVMCRKKKRVYKYNFVTMCVDLATNGSWKRINTNLVLAAISTIFNLKIVIIQNEGMVYAIETGINQNTKTIYMGLIDEVHYFPLAERKGHRIENVCPKYIDNVTLFHQWARGMAIVTGNVLYDNDFIDSSDEEVVHKRKVKKNHRNHEKHKNKY